MLKGWIYGSFVLNNRNAIYVHTLFYIIHFTTQIFVVTTTLVRYVDNIRDELVNLWIVFEQVFCLWSSKKRKISFRKLKAVIWLPDNLSHHQVVLYTLPLDLVWVLAWRVAWDNYEVGWTVFLTSPVPHVSP